MINVARQPQKGEKKAKNNYIVSHSFRIKQGMKCQKQDPYLCAFLEYQ